MWQRSAGEEQELRILSCRGILILFSSFFALGIPTSCTILFTNFRNVFVFTLRRYVPMGVNFLGM